MVEGSQVTEMVVFVVVCVSWLVYTMLYFARYVLNPSNCPFHFISHRQHTQPPFLTQVEIQCSQPLTLAPTRRVERYGCMDYHNDH